MLVPLHCSAVRKAQTVLRPRRRCPRSGEWHGNLVRIQRSNVLLLCHDATRFILAHWGATKDDIVGLDTWAPLHLAPVLRFDGVPEPLILKATKALGALAWDRATDRSVLGTMNIALQDFTLGYALDPEAKKDPVASSRWLNNRPVTVRASGCHQRRRWGPRWKRWHEHMSTASRDRLSALAKTAPEEGLRTGAPHRRALVRLPGNGLRPSIRTCVDGRQGQH